MEFAYFTKHWPGVPVAELAKTARKLGADGLDLAVRERHAVNPHNVRRALPDAVRVCGEEGVKVCMVTMETARPDPNNPATEAVFAACSEAGVRWVKLGYFPYQPGEDYWAEVERIRRTLAELGRMAARHSVVACYHTHSGMMYGSNAGTLMHLLRGQDATALGAYLDVGHLALNGEALPLALDIARDYLQLIGVKSPAWTPQTTREGATKWIHSFVPITQGAVDCRQMFKELRRVGFDGVLSFHGEYEIPPEELPNALKHEIAYCRELLRQS
jgi:sugar phosphate isomerase/epimerase